MAVPLTPPPSPKRISVFPTCSVYRPTPTRNTRGQSENVKAGLLKRFATGSSRSLICSAALHQYFPQFTSVTSVSMFRFQV